MKRSNGISIGRKAGGLDKAIGGNNDETTIIRAISQTSVFVQSTPELPPDGRRSRRGRRGRRSRRGRRLVAGIEIDKIVDVKKPSWQAEYLAVSPINEPPKANKKKVTYALNDESYAVASRNSAWKKDNGAHSFIQFGSSQNYIETNTSVLNLVKTNSNGPESNMHRPLPTLGQHIDFAIRKHNSEVLIKDAIWFGANRTGRCSDKDKKNVAKYLLDNNVVFKIDIDYWGEVTDAYLGLSGSIIYLRVGEELLIVEGVSTKFEITADDEYPTIFYLKSSEGKSYTCCSEDSGCSRTTIILAVKAFFSKACMMMFPKMYWKKPPSGCLKLNTTGLAFPDGVGMGNLIRDEWGEWVIGSWGSLEDSLDDIAIGLIALREGLSLAYRYNPNAKYIIETSYNIPLALIKGLMSCRKEAHKDLLRQCKEGMEALPGCEIKPISYQSDRASYWLAKAGRTVTGVKIDDEPPDRESLLLCLAREMAALPSRQ